VTPPEPIMEASDEGSAPRSRRLDSMIAGRRRASDAPRTTSSSRSDDGDEKPARSRTRRSDDSDEKPTRTRSARPARAKSDDDTEEKPARSRRVPASDSDSEDEGDKPRVRRSRRGGRGRSRDDAPQTDGDESETPEAVAETKDAEDTTEVEEKPKRRTRRAASTSDDGDLGSLREAVERQEAMLAELRDGIEGLGNRIVRSGYRPRVAIFVDVPNLIYGYEGDGSLNMGKLLTMITEGRDLVRATAYSPVSDDPREPVEQQRFVAPFVPHEYRIVTKPLKRFSDGSIKGNFDVEMAVDMVMMADRVDVICIVSGDADFARAVEVVQQKGVRVEVVAFAGSTSIEMRAIADHYFELDRVVKQIL